MVEQTMPPNEALLWLAKLEKSCLACRGSGSEATGTTYGGQHEQVACSICGGSGKVLVLPDLREPCPGVVNIAWVEEHLPCMTNDPGWWKNTPPNEGDIDPCHGTGWVPKQGRDALYQAMNNAGWYMTLITRPKAGYKGESLRYVYFWNDEGRHAGGGDADDYLAAVKALKEAGYGT